MNKAPSMVKIGEGLVSVGVSKNEVTVKLVDESCLLDSKQFPVCLEEYEAMVKVATVTMNDLVSQIPDKENDESKVQSEEVVVIQLVPQSETIDTSWETGQGNALIGSAAHVVDVDQIKIARTCAE